LLQKNGVRKTITYGLVEFAEQLCEAGAIKKGKQ
jgi:hypothetical protein